MLQNLNQTKPKKNWLNFSHYKSKQTFPNLTKHANQITQNSFYQPFIANIIATPDEYNATTTPAATTTTILRTAKPAPRTKRRPSVTFKLPTENDREPNDRPTDILETSAPLSLTNPSPCTFVSTAAANAATEELKKHDTQPGDNVNIDNKGVMAAAAAEAGALMTQPEDMNAIVMEIDDVAVEPFVAKQSAHVPVAPAFIDEAHRQFSNPISYLGGPLLKPRNRYSIESILSLD